MFQDLTGEKDSPYATSMSDGKNRARLAKAPSHLTSVFDFKEDESPEWRQRVLKYSESWPFLLFIVVLSLWALFSDDLRLAACPPASDPFFLYSTYFMIVVFTAELGKFEGKLASISFLHGHVYTRHVHY